MQLINKLLDRIRWDREFGAAVFEIGYLDRLAGLIVKRPFVDLFFEPDNKESFLLMDKEGMYQRIPLHRVRELYRNGELIWQRPGTSDMIR
ncbi:MAG: DUF504 domain-containing protein [Desulfocapsaceae bacterium]|nr:DUF504 domain-containing protein [Desulfocapsaceae bacterium]